MLINELPSSFMLRRAKWHEKCRLSLAKGQALICVMLGMAWTDSRRVRRVLYSIRQVIGHFGDESFQTVENTASWKTGRRACGDVSSW